MSSAYHNEPPTNGKVILKTDIGDFEIELWPKEAPKATRNFVQLCLERYYVGCSFHRVVPKFIAQTGDPTGTGTGGESIYGGKFDVEAHSRLKFSHRGIVAMASDEHHGTNSSQFFFTLDAAPDLNGHHTIFGKIVGETMFNLLKFNDLEIVDDRPVFEPKIIGIEVRHNPFPDIVRRQTSFGVSSSVKSLQQARYEEARQSKSEKKTVLLSFGDEDTAQETFVAKKSKPNAPPKAQQEQKQEVSQKSKTDLQKEQVRLEIQKVEDDLKKMSENARRREEKRMGLDEEKAKAKTVKRTLTPLEQEKDMFLENQLKKNRVVLGGASSRKNKREDDVLEKLAQFQSKIRKSKSEPLQESARELCSLHNVPNCESCGFASNNSESSEGWMGHTLKFEKDLAGKNLLDSGARRMDNVEELVVIDPRKRAKN